MKNILQKLTLLMVPFMVLGCGATKPSADESKDDESSKPIEQSSNEGSSSAAHEHQWSDTWESDGTNHWHTCSGCDEKKDFGTHTFGEWQTANLGERLNDARFNLSTIKFRACTACQYEELDKNQAVLPEIRFNFEATDSKGNPQEMNFATIAKSTDVDRPKVEGVLKITNAGDKNVTDGYAKTKMKVRGNQTAGFNKKGFQINLDKKQNLLGLNGGKKFKKWVLLADAKDTTVSRTALGLSMCKGIIAEDSNVWSSDFTPVSVYLNDVYWGMYMLAEQKEVKDGRIKLDEPIEEIEGVETPIMTTNIGYCFEMDYYAKNEANKGADGDPTFSIDYGSFFNRQSFNIESPLANSGLGVVNTYTMNSDINDSTATGNQHTDENYSNQLKFIKNRLTALWNVLGNAVKNNTAKDINDNNEVISTSMTVKQAIEKHFDLNAWAEGFIINAVCLPPDVGYSSFYMSFDNTPTGDHKLRYDNPWDFDSNFGNRRGFITTADSKEGNYDPYFMDRTANMWLQFLGKLDFFMNDYVKPKWQAARQNKVFEGMISMAQNFYKYYDGEYQRNFTKWTTTQASDPNVSSYFNGDGERSGELRTPFVKVTDRAKAQAETINWLTKRVAYLDGKWK